MTLASTEDQIKFLEALAEGKSLLDAARIGGRPLSYWRRLASSSEAFGRAFREAMFDHSHALAHEALQIADKANENDKAGVMKAKLQVDTRLKLAKAYNRDTYGDKVEQTTEIVHTRKTEFVSYFGVKKHRQEEASLEDVIDVIAELPERVKQPDPVEKKPDEEE